MAVRCLVSENSFIDVAGTTCVVVFTEANEFINNGTPGQKDKLGAVQTTWASEADICNVYQHNMLATCQRKTFGAKVCVRKEGEDFP